MLQIGSKVGRYQVESLIGEGDLASTWKVSASGATYALRVLVVRDQGFRERLWRASTAQANVDHPNLLRVVDVIEADGSPGVVTEFVEGTDLETWIAAGPHRIAEVLTLFHQMVAGVRAAHAAGLLHRNLKPSKVLIGREPDGAPRVRIADFLLGKVRSTAGAGAAVTQLGTTFGTPQYMSPEQFRGAASVDERGDLFALGCLLYEMATGQRAFDGPNLLEVYQQVSNCQYRPVNEARAGLPKWVGDVVGGLLKPEPADRIQTADLLLAKIRAIEAAMIPATPPPSPTPRPAPPLSVPKPAGQRPSGNKRANPTITPTPSTYSAEDSDDELPAPPHRPTVLLVTAALMVGLTIGLGFVVAIGAVAAWWLGGR
ncbi:MAG: serine/threonine-protein kinase [Myxococcota bacterium]